MSNFRAYATVFALCCGMAVFAPDLSGPSRALTVTDEAAPEIRELQTAGSKTASSTQTASFSTAGRVGCTMKTASGSLAVNFARSVTIRQVKFQIQRRSKIRVERQVLSLGGVTLDDSRTVGSYNIQRNSDLAVKENTAVALEPTVSVVMKTAQGNKLAVAIAKTASIREIKSVASIIQTNAEFDVKTAAAAATPTTTQTAGVNGDPLIMGLSDQLFYFNGRNGAYYSAVSAPSLQWNMKITEYDGCPADSNTFVSGAGFTFFDEKKVAHEVEVAVVDEQHVDVGCGAGEADNCLGAGSLEITIDGNKVVAGGDYELGSYSRIIAYNTFHQCSRKWYDFDVKPIATAQHVVGLRTPSRRLSSETTPAVFDVIHGLKDTTIDRAVCEDWLAERQSFDDLFAQPGHSSTVIIQTPDVNFHIEYRQETERCNAHLLDVWMSSVSPSLLNQEWEGVIGETKTPSLQGVDTYSRQAVLKYAGDADYEVACAYSTKCKGCTN